LKRFRIAAESTDFAGPLIGCWSRHEVAATDLKPSERLGRGGLTIADVDARGVIIFS
jgi:hypothetical protein